MRILYIADGRSPIAMNWIEYFLRGDCEVHLASTFPCEGDKRLASLSTIPVAFSGMKLKAGAGGHQHGLWSASLVRARTAIRQWLGPLTLREAARRLQDVVTHIQPDLLHAMRLPYEGMLAAQVDTNIPLLVSVWGNDFTLHAPSTPLMARHTRQALARTDALHTDCQRDLRLAGEWGFVRSKPAVVLPGAGGIQLDTFYPPEIQNGREFSGEPLVVNPRGFRAYVRNDTFFKAVPLVLARLSKVRFACLAMAGETRAERWLKELGIVEKVELLQVLTRPQVAELFRRAQVAVSPSTHDGTPNTLLEAMACGCFPVAGDIESLREWITPGENGLLVDPSDPQALADAILAALKDAEMRKHATTYNRKLIVERADYGDVMEKAEEFYRQITY